MGSDRNSRSGIQTAADLARRAKAIYNIIRAAAAAGLKGAAVAAVKETLPFLIKVAVGVLVVVLLVPIVIFTALPNIFFGFDSSDTEKVKEMTEQALEVAGAYMSIEDYETYQMDAIVTSLVGRYNEEGTQIDDVEVVSEFSEEDLNWLIAINSVAHKQDLSTMDADSILDLDIFRLSYSVSLLKAVLGVGDGSIIKTTLKVDFKRMDPETLMVDLGFDEEAKTWAGALYETLSESDAMNKYAGQFEGYRPDYSGDNSYSGGIRHEGEADNAIDISGFVSPETKNNLDLAAYAVQAWENGWGYVWGTYGNVLTESLLTYKLEQYPDGVGNYEDFIRENWLGGRTADCIGLIKGYGWLDTSDLTIDYGTNGVPDYNANQMYQYAKSSGAAGIDYGTMDTMPDIPGLMLWKKGHVGVYIGGGYVIEAKGTSSGVVKTEVEGRGWSGWCKLPYLTYLEEE